MALNKNPPMRAPAAGASHVLGRRGCVVPGLDPMSAPPRCVGGTVAGQGKPVNC
jgi:hypothetical protein